LTIQELVAVSRGNGCGEFPKVELAGDWRERCQRSADYVRSVVDATMGRSREELAKLARERAPRDDASDGDRLAQRALIYGVTTGFGYFKSRPLDSFAAAEQMQINILRSHATGVGPPMPTEVVRAMMLLRVRTFVQGHSAVRPRIVEFLVECLNRKVHPWVPEQGSVGSSGDLCPLSHLSLILIGEGLAWSGQDEFKDRGTNANTLIDPRLDKRPVPRPAAVVLAEAGLNTMVQSSLAPKEGIALSNGTSASTAYAALAAYDASILLGTANAAVAASLQALLGATRALDPKVHALRRHEGQARAARQIASFLHGSSLADRSNDVQDAYSVRCAPAVHGAALHAIEHAWSTIEREINAVTDNPLFFDSQCDGPPCDDYAACIWDAYAAGNFHGEPVGIVCDYLKIAVAELANISERRVQALLDEHHSRGLPSNLWPDRATAGLNSGLMITQYTAASLVSENKSLAHPASVDSIPTSSNVEDHVAMSTIAARHARRVVDNARSVLAIEVLVALQGIELRLAACVGTDMAKASAAAEAVRRLVRNGDERIKAVAHLSDRDRLLWPDIASINEWIHSGDLLRAALHAAADFA
jgi:histidine ammonia-lyase